MRVNAAAPFHPDVLHPSLRPTIYCPHVEECLALRDRRTIKREDS